MRLQLVVVMNSRSAHAQRIRARKRRASQDAYSAHLALCDVTFCLAGTLIMQSPHPPASFRSCRLPLNGPPPAPVASQLKLPSLAYTFPHPLLRFQPHLQRLSPRYCRGAHHEVHRTGLHGRSLFRFDISRTRARPSRYSRIGPQGECTGHDRPVRNSCGC